MPASSSFPSDNRGRWKKRRKEPQLTKKSKHCDEAEEEGEDEELERDDDEAIPQSAPPNRTVEPFAPECEVLVDGGIRVSDFPVVVRHTVNRPHASVLEIVALERAIQFGDAKNQTANPISLENISYGQLQALSAVPIDCPALAVGDQESGKYVISPPKIMEGCGIVKRFGHNHALVLPMHADWFTPTTVHRLERQVVPHFFSGQSPDHTPERYLDCRNSIVAKYMENPEKRLLITDCQGVMIDAEDLTRIFRFLENWGIINYCATASKQEPWNGGSCLREEVNGEVHVPSTALKSIESLVHFDRPKCRLKAADVYPSIRSPIEPDLDRRIRERLSEHCCNHCSEPISVVCYQSQKEVDVLLCSDCFHEGKFVVGHSSIDFVKTVCARDHGDSDGETWSDQETLLMLEAVEIYSDNWNEIAEHVGSKSKAQCMLHFIRLPTDNGLMENIEFSGMPKAHSCAREDFGISHITSNGSGYQDPTSRLPFANSGNPVMSLVAFLASAVGPRVAAACAHAALEALSEDDDPAGNIMQQMEGSEINTSSRKKMERGKEGGQRSWDGEREGEVGAGVLLSTEKVKKAAKAGLSAAAMKAKVFADHEEREIQRLSANIINHQLKRLEVKLKHFAEVETLLMKECEKVERGRQWSAGERSRLIMSSMPSPMASQPLMTAAAAAIPIPNHPFMARQHQQQQMSNPHQFMRPVSSTSTTLG